MKSIYQRLRERNLCNHRDFQNIGVNGARTTSMQPPGVINAFQRNPADDHPVLVFYALVRLACPRA
jgi:acyloxyacyl hydrolase